MKSKLVCIFSLLLVLSNSAFGSFNNYVLDWHEKYKIKEQQCLEEARANNASTSEILLLRKYKQKDINAYAIKKGIDHKIKCTSKELVQILHSAWVAHRVSAYDKDVKNFDYILDEIVDPRYLDAIIHLGGVSRKTLEQLDQIEYFQKPFDIESRPWE